MIILRSLLAPLAAFHLAPSRLLLLLLALVPVAALAAPPVVSSRVASVGGTGARINVTLEDLNILEFGIVWAQTAVNNDPMLNGNGVQSVRRTSAFALETAFSATPLTIGTQYSFRGYARNTDGTTYSNVGTFTTPAPGSITITVPFVASNFNPASAPYASVTGTVTVTFDPTVTVIETPTGFTVSLSPNLTGSDRFTFASNSGILTFGGAGGAGGISAASTDYRVRIVNAGGGYTADQFEYAANGNSIYGAQSVVSLPGVASPTSADLQARSATLGGEVVSTGGNALVARGVVYAKTSVNASPALDNGATVQPGSGTLGVFTVPVTNLEPATQYTYRAYATNGNYTAYSAPATFTTAAGGPATTGIKVTLPTATTDGSVEFLQDLTFTITRTGQLRSILLDEWVAMNDGSRENTILQGSLRYTINGGPVVTTAAGTFTDNTADTFGNYTPNDGALNYGFQVTAGDRITFKRNSFVIPATNSPINPQAAQTFQGNLYLIEGDSPNFSLMSGPVSAATPTAPEVDTPTRTGITSTSATLGGQVAFDGGESVTERGVVYSATNTNPLITDSDVVKTTASGSIGVFTITASPLTPETKYYFKAYAKNSVGTTYSALTTFDTTPLPAASFSVSGPTTAFAGVPFNITVTARNSQGGVATGYAGTVHLTSSDAAATLPADATLTNGVGTFTVTFSQTGSWTVTATDTADSSLTGAGTAVPTTRAQLPLVGFDSFETEGVLEGMSGGNGWDYDRINGARTGNKSVWQGTNATVRGGAIFLATFGSASRPFNGTIVGNQGDDGPNTERAGAVRGEGAVFFRFDMTRDSSRNVCLFGAGTSDGSTFYFGSNLDGFPQVSTPSSTVAGTTLLAPNQKYTLVAVIDYENDRVGLFVNPDANDRWDGTGGTADVMTTYTGSDWVSRIQLLSGNTAVFDNIKVANTFAEAVAPTVPELTAPTLADNAGTSATLGGEVTAPGLTAITERGIIYAPSSLNSNPAFTGVGIIVVPDAATTTGVFTLSVPDLVKGRDYTFRAYAKNSVGTAYTRPVAFTAGVQTLRLTNAIGGQRQGTAFVVGTVGLATGANNWPASEPPANAIDGQYDNKHLTFANVDSGLIVTPDAASASIVVNRLSLWTANDVPNRDPKTYSIYGSATALSDATPAPSYSLSALTLIAQGTVTLPDARQTGPTNVNFLNTTAYASYIIVFDTVKSGSQGTQIAELALSDTSAIAPRFTSVSPATGPEAGGSTVVITGSNFTGTTAILFGTKAAAAFTVVDDNTLNVTTPAHVAGEVDVTVTNAEGSLLVAGAFTFVPLPVVESPTSTDVTATTATLGGNVTSDGGLTITERGVVYAVNSTNSQPALNGLGVLKATATGTTGVFTVAVTGLEGNTTYAYRAYATSSGGTAYSAVATFTTPVAYRGVNDSVKPTAGATRIYPLANDVSPSGAPLRLVSTNGIGVTIDPDGRSLVIPAGYTGTFTYTFTDGTTVGEATVTVENGIPATTGFGFSGLLRDNTGATGGIGYVLFTRSGRAATVAMVVGTKTVRTVVSFAGGNTTGTRQTAQGVVSLTRNPDGTASLTLASASGNLTGGISARQAVGSLQRYRMALASVDATVPGGGFIFATVFRGGYVVLNGLLPDGSTFLLGTLLRDNGTIALYTPVRRGNSPPALLGGELVLANLAATDLTGELAWLKPVQRAGLRGRHLAGVDTLLTVNGSLAGALPSQLNGPGVLQLSGGNLAQAETNAVTVTAGKPAVPTSSLASWTVYRSGYFLARVRVPGALPVLGRGVYLPKSHQAWGYFPGTATGGRIELVVPQVP